MPKKSGAYRGKKESTSMKQGAKSKGGSKGSGKASGSWKKIPGMNGGSKSKNGCFPKVFMLLLPFIAVGSYLFLRS